MSLPLEQWSGKVAVVTGASSGIGAAIVEQLVVAGLKVAGLARRKNKIIELAKKLEGEKGKLYAFQVDITKEEDILQAFKSIKQDLGPVHILINNAGVVRVTNLTEGDTQLWKDVLDTNVLGLCIATREAVKDMKENNVAGHIVHINSIAGHYVPSGAGADSNIYAASKHAVTALTETLRQELNTIGSKIKVTSISPGFVKTEVIEAAFIGSGKESELPEMAAVWKDIACLEAKDVADAVIYVLSTPSHVQVHELTIRPIGEKF